MAAIAVSAVALYQFFGAATEVYMMPVKRGTALDAVSGNVSVEASLDIDLKNREPGLIVESVYDPMLGGVPVRAGQIVFKQDTRDLDFKLDNKKLELETVRQRIENGSPLEPDLETAKQRHSSRIG